MSSFPLHVLVLWACSALAQLIVFILLVSKGSFRKTPVFTVYIALNLCQVAYLVTLYSIPKLSDGTVREFAWYSECVTLAAQALATTEILKITLRPYQGIWGLVWRSLTVTSTFVVALVALTTRGDWANAKWFELNRGYHLTFAATVIACLLVVRYYSIQVPSAYKMILGGFCFYSCSEILLSNIVQTLLKTQYAAFQPIWQSLTMLPFIGVVTLWAVALRKPLPVDNRQAPTAPDSVYSRLSPEINERLREINEKLLRLWKMEARPQ
jgi:hypothetical protein